MRAGRAGVPFPVKGRRRPIVRVGLRRARALLLVWLIVLAGCTWSSEEPGLFGESRPSRQPQDSVAPLRPTDPRLPVLGERIWTTGEGLSVTVRIAVHAVRRVSGATVLDWSITPLAAPGLGTGDLLPTSVDFGLTREAGAATDIVLVDRSGGHAYRPLASSGFAASNGRSGGTLVCVCAPLWVAQLAIRIGETRLLQVGYPELPADLGYVDVAPSTVSPFLHVPVSPENLVPVTGRPVDLTRPAGSDPPDLGSLTFPSRQAGEQRLQRITVNDISAGASSTTLSWTLTSVTDQPNVTVLPYGPPVAAELPARVGVFNPGSASGPRLQVGGPGGRTLAVGWMTGRVQNNGTFYECLCSNLGLWASSLQRGGNRVQVVTTYGPLPPGTRVVDVVLSGAGVIRGVPVTAAADSAAAVGQRPAGPPKRWTATRFRPPTGWPTDEWPTPTPDPGQLSGIDPVVEDLTELPAGR